MSTEEQLRLLTVLALAIALTPEEWALILQDPGMLVNIDKPTHTVHGDFSTNIVLRVAAKLNREPQELATQVAAVIQDIHDYQAAH